MDYILLFILACGIMVIFGISTVVVFRGWFEDEDGTPNYKPPFPVDDESQE